MKKILFILLLAIACLGCERGVRVDLKAENAIYGWTYISDDNVMSYEKFRKITIDGHEYLLFVNKNGYSGGICVIHSESCPCKQKKK